MIGTVLIVVAVIVGAVVAAALGLWMFGERGRLMLPSTWRYIQAGGIRRLLNGQFFHGYVYGRWTNQYIRYSIRRVFPRVESRQDSGRQWADDYHGKVLTHNQAEAVITIEQDIPLRDLEQVIPYARARDLVLSGPPDVVVYECCCRHARQNPCQPTQVCMVIGQPFADFVLEHNPHSARRLAQADALDLLRAEHERGHAHVAYFKDAMLDRFYAICNCCKCCCGGIESMVRLGVPMVASSGYVAQVDDALCAACGTCEETCPFTAIQVKDVAVINWEACMGCGVCTGQCPEEAVSLVRDERKGTPLDVRLLA